MINIILLILYVRDDGNCNSQDKREISHQREPLSWAARTAQRRARWLPCAPQVRQPRAPNGGPEAARAFPTVRAAWALRAIEATRWAACATSRVPSSRTFAHRPNERLRLLVPVREGRWAGGDAVCATGSRAIVAQWAARRPPDALRARAATAGARGAQSACVRRRARRAARRAAATRSRVRRGAAGNGAARGACGGRRGRARRRPNRCVAARAQLRRLPPPTRAYTERALCRRGTNRDRCPERARATLLHVVPARSGRRICEEVTVRGV